MCAPIHSCLNAFMAIFGLKQCIREQGEPQPGWPEIVYVFMECAFYYFWAHKEYNVKFVLFIDSHSLCRRICVCGARPTINFICITILCSAGMNDGQQECLILLQLNEYRIDNNDKEDNKKKKKGSGEFRDCDWDNAMHLGATQSDDHRVTGWTILVRAFITEMSL